MKRFLYLFFVPVLCFGKPHGANIVSGQGKVIHVGKSIEIHTSDRVVIEWDDFNIDRRETVRFVQPNSNSAVLNRVLNGSTQIDGLLNGNGKIYLHNPNGIQIGKGGRILSNGFVATTLDVNDRDFVQNKDLLLRGRSESKIVNLGQIQALGGDIHLLARAVVNKGSVEAPMGVVGIAAADEVLLKPSGEQRLFISSKKIVEEMEVGIENDGVIEAASAELRADGNVYRFAINQKGIIEANGINEKDGKVFLVAEGGKAFSSGTIIAKSAYEVGGHVQMIGTQVGLIENGEIDVTGEFGGGRVELGKGNATKVSVVLNNAKIHAEAEDCGNGGKVTIRGSECALIQGKIQTQGGPRGGEDGLLEVSGGFVIDESEKKFPNLSTSSNMMGFPILGLEPASLIFPEDELLALGVPKTLYNNYGRAISEMFQNLKTYDDLLFTAKCFLLEYDTSCYDRQLHPKGMVSSYDLFNWEERPLLRQNWRNYHTKYVESF